MDYKMDYKMDYTMDYTKISENIQKISLYYSPHEYYFGEGFYPVFERSATYSKEITIEFKLDQYLFWRQSSNTEHCIMGMETNIGKQILEKLNESCITAYGIKDKYGTILYPKRVVF
jgi:hypothetical protein